MIFNNNAAANGCETLINMLFSGYTGDAVSVFVSRAVGMRLIGAHDPATYTCTQGGATTPAPARGHVDGLKLSMDAVFHGWGYAHQFEYGSGTLKEVGKPYAVPEGIDEKFALGYGDLSIHEWATDPDQNLAYASYYAAACASSASTATASRSRATTSRAAAATSGASSSSRPRAGERLIAASDRDFGLYIFRYTGPDAPPRPGAPDARRRRRRRRSAGTGADRAEGHDEAADHVAVDGEPEPAQAARRHADDPAAAR